MTAMAAVDWTVSEIEISRITQVPDWHPETDGFESTPVHAWLIRGGSSTILMDTGIGFGSDLIDEWYAPERHEVGDALAPFGVAVSDIDLVVVSHLHFDHCGQIGAFEAPVVVQKDELAMLDDPIYTVAAWAERPSRGWRVIDGDDEVAPGVRVLSTPGHTPGHQSMMVETAEGTIVLGGQCAYTCGEIAAGRVADGNLHDSTSDWRRAADASLQRLIDLDPLRVLLSHDRCVRSSLG